MGQTYKDAGSGKRYKEDYKVEAKEIRILAQFEEYCNRGIQRGNKLTVHYVPYH